MQQMVVIRSIVISVFLAIATAFPVQANDYPHAAVNDIGCMDCHDFSNWAGKLLKVTMTGPPLDITETPVNNLCRSCHNSGPIAPNIKTHSSIAIDDDYGDWSLECTDCHNPHSQEQYRSYGAESYLTPEGVITSVTQFSVTDNAANWIKDEFSNTVVFIQNGRGTSRTPTLSYRIVGNTTTTLTIDPGNSGNGINVTEDTITWVRPNDTYRVVYGKLFKRYVDRPDRGQPLYGSYTLNGAVGDTCSVTSNVFSCANTISMETKFLRDFRKQYTGLDADNEHAFAGDLDGDGDYQGPCEICHTRTKYHRNNYSNDPTPNSQNTSDHTHNVPLKCTFCHKHINGFLPLGAGAHEVHLTKEFGPKITCSSGGGWGCHGAFVPGSNYPGEVIFADGLPLCDGRPGTPCPSTGTDTGTQVCANCHGEGSALAKYYFFRPGSSEGTPGIWVTSQSGPYTWDDTWLGDIGEKKYCGSCHNDTPVTFVTGPQPPGQPANVVGDLDIAQPDDTGTYGFFNNGHGKATGNYQQLSWQSSAETGNPAAARICSDCHEYTKTHFSNPDPNDKRLKPGYENDAASTVCDACHGLDNSNGDIAYADPKYYTDHAAFEISAHGADSKQNLKCTDCHDPHGAAYQDVATNGETNQAMTKGYKQGLCFRCHTDDTTSEVIMNVQNFAVAGHKGIHDGADNSTVLADADGSYFGVATLGSDWIVYNLTDGSSGAITNHSATQITATLIGGTENDWDLGDQYHISKIDDIEEAFSLGSSHPLGKMFTLEGESYTLNCVSCHNVHLVTGQYWEADLDKAPITRISKPSNREANLTVYGDDAGEKMADFANLGGGFYQTPLGDTFDENQLPAYPQFCTDCHSNMNLGGQNKGVNWGQAGGSTGWLDMHGLGSAGVTAGSSSPDAYYKATKTNNWPRNDNTGFLGYDYSWPKHQAGRGRAMWNIGAYESADRFAGINYVLSCTDCHEPHGSNAARKMGRPRINGGAGSLNAMGQNCASNCHFRENSGANNQYTPHINGGGCGYGSCHGVTTGESIHNMDHRGSGGAVPAYNFDQVLDMKFEGNLNDSGTWNMSGQWAAGSNQTWGDWSSLSALAGAYGAGLDGGQALLIQNQPISSAPAGNSGRGAFVEPGSTNGNWSTDGTHRADRFFSFKYGLAFEMWVNPSDYPALDNGDTWQWSTPDRYLISKAGWGNWADYSMMLRYIDGDYRLYAQFNVNGGIDVNGAMIPNNVNTNCLWDDCGWRGAFSSVAIPKNQWSHVAVTYDASQLAADHDPNDLSKGRIRIYVNGEDVTTSHLPSNGYYEVTQPLDGEGEGQNPDVGIGLNTCTTHINTDRGSWESSSAWCQWRMTIGSQPWANTLTHFEGLIDNLKIWNIAKDATYFDEQIPPVISEAYGYDGDDKVYIVFAEGAYANTDGTGDLQPADFVLTDSDNGPIISVQHTAGDSTATLTLTTNLDVTDLGIDTVVSFENSIYDSSGTIAAHTSNAVVIAAVTCPQSSVRYDFNDPVGSVTAASDTGLLTGNVQNGTVAFVGDGYFHFNGDGNPYTANAADTFVEVPNAGSCLGGERTYTYEVRFKPAEVDLDSGNANLDQSTQTIFQRKRFNSLRLRRADFMGDRLPPAGQTYLWTNFTTPVNNVVPQDPSGLGHGQSNKEVYGDVATCPIVEDHWYRVRVVYNADRKGSVPVDIFAEDQGTDGAGAGQNWAGFINCTQASLQAEEWRLSEGIINKEDRWGPSSHEFFIGNSADLNQSLARDANPEAGTDADSLMDWLSYTPVADYSGLDVPGLFNVESGDGQIELSWSPVAGATAYNIYWGTDPYKFGEHPGVTPTNGTKITLGNVLTYTHTGRTNGTNYYYVVTAAADTETAPSSQAGAMPVSGPPTSAPTNLTAEGGAGPNGRKVVLYWDDVPNATSYNIYWKTESGVTTATYNRKFTKTYSPFTHIWRTNGDEDCYIITAVNKHGEASVASSEACATPNPSPSSIVATAGDQQAAITWDAAAGASSYNIYWSTDPDAMKTTANKLENKVSGFIHTGLTNGTTYYYNVSAAWPGGEETFYYAGRVNIEGPKTRATPAP